MTLYILAQLVGFLGYGFHISAPYFKTQQQIMKVGLIGLVLLCLQWFLLNQMSLVAFNLLLILTTCLALGKYEEKQTQQQLMLVLQIFGLTIILSVSQGNVIDILAMIAFSLSVISRFSESITNFRLYAGIAGILLSICGAMAMAMPALLFNAIYAIMHFYYLSTMHHDRAHAT